MSKEPKPDHADLAPDEELQPSSIFARRYRIEFLRATGGMGRVYKAYDLVLQRYVALKFVTGGDPELERRLIAEAQAQARVDHDYVCKIFDFGREDGRLFIAMHYVEGESFDRARNWDLRKKVALMRNIADGVHAAHESGLIHRDIKPSNILLELSGNDEPRPCILDFGLVRDTTRADQSSTGTVHGTPSYMSPEQALGEVHKVDRRSDVYSLGATFYELLAGQCPFQGSVIDVILKVLEEDPDPLRKRVPAIPPDLETIIMKCLEKEPDRRYESAKSLAEDLRRFLDNEPILGKRTTLGYRVAKKIKKYPAFFAMLTAAILLILGLLALGIRARLFATRQMQMANLFNQEIQYLEQRLRYAYTSPIHDIRPEEAEALGHLQQMKDRITAGGKAAAGPGNYALGRGYLALQKYPEASQYLQKARDRFDYRLPQVSYTLGLSQAMTYRKELEQAERMLNREMREARKNEIEKQFGVPARQNILLGKEAASESPEYAEAVLALLKKKYDHALRQSEASLKRFPWLYSAREVEGDVYLSMGNEKRDKGDIQAGLQDYRKAESAYEEVIRKANSDPRAYEKMCGLHGDVMTLQTYYGGVSPQESYKKAMEACSSALVADPHSSAAEHFISAAKVRWSEYQMQHGEDPRPALKEAVAAAEKSLRFGEQPDVAYGSAGNALELISEYELYHGEDPSESLKSAINAFASALKANANYIIATEGMGNSYLVEGQNLMFRGQDPRPSINRAIQSFQRTLTINPRFSFSYSNTAVCYQLRGQYEAARGLDPRSSQDSAIGSLQKALQLNSRNAAVLSNLGSILIEKALFEMNHGFDPRASVKRIIDALERAIQIDSKNASAYANLNAGYAILAQYQMKFGLDAKDALQKAIEGSRKAVDANPLLDVGHLNLASSWNDQALWLLENSKNPEQALKESRAAHVKAHEVNPNQPVGYLTHGQAEIIALRWALFQNTPTMTFATAAEANLMKALKLNPEFSDAIQSLAELRYWKASKNRNIAEIQTGLSFADRAIAINPLMAEAHGIKGMLLLLLPVSSENSKAAQEELLEAIKLNTNLRRKYEPFLR